MNLRWNFPFHRVFLLYLCGILLGGEAALLATKNVSVTAGCLEIVSMVLVSLLLVMTSHVRDMPK